MSGGEVLGITVTSNGLNFTATATVWDSENGSVADAFDYTEVTVYGALYGLAKQIENKAKGDDTIDVQATATKLIDQFVETIRKVDGRLLPPHAVEQAKARMWPTEGRNA